MASSPRAGEITPPVERVARPARRNDTHCATPAHTSAAPLSEGSSKQQHPGPWPRLGVACFVSEDGRVLDGPAVFPERPFDVRSAR